jgi:glutamate/aspartate transport system substrate-binding protein
VRRKRFAEIVVAGTVHDVSRRLRANACTLTMACTLIVLAAPVAADPPVSTLRKIKETRTIVIGHRESSIPFSYLDENNRPIGYSIDICAKVVDALRDGLGIPDLAIRYQPVTSKDRIPLVKNGSVDLECGSTTNNLDRQREVAFSVTLFVAANRLVAKKGAGIRTLPNVKNKTVVSTAGTTSLKQVRDFNDSYRYGMTILEGKDHAESFSMVEDGRAAAFSMDDILLASLVANSRNPGDYNLTIQALSVEPYGIMMRRGDPAFKRVVDDAIIRLFRTGEIGRIYAKWFEAPIPPKNVILNVPMSDTLRKVIKNPTDSGNPAVYH